jgi:hypothetical protein
MKLQAIVITLLVSMVSGSVEGATYQVGPGKTYARLQDVADILNPGDRVLVDGDNTYPANVYIDRSGTAGQPIVISGIRPFGGGTRPVITGGGSYGINVSGDNVVLEGFDIDGGPKGIGVFGNNLTVRNCVIHGCNHGLIGYGTGTGSVTVEYCEFYGNGVPTGGATQHQIYMATDEEAHPGATFRLQYCYLHDCVEGDNVKSRSERNEIYYNWIERAGTSGHGLGLFAPDPDDNDQVQINTAREDAEVIGNVIIQHRNSCARIGGDLAGYPTNGRYRFVNNTFVLTGTRGDAIRTFNTIETLEMYNNVIYGGTSGADIRVINDADGAWVHTPRSLTGSHNWVVNGATRVPDNTEWTNTIRGSASPFTDYGTNDFLPGLVSPLIDAGTSGTATNASYPFPDPTSLPTLLPPVETLIDTGTAQARPSDGNIDIGAFEAGSQGIGAHRFSMRPVMNGLPVYTVYDLGGKVVKDPDTGSGLRIIRYQDGERSVTRTTVFIK